jgi:hypothetical protein
MAVSNGINPSFVGPVTVMGVQFLAGSGAPSASVPKGSFYLRTDGSSSSTRMYIATDAVGTWTAVTTAA